MLSQDSIQQRQAPVDLTPVRARLKDFVERSVDEVTNAMKSWSQIVNGLTLSGVFQSSTHSLRIAVFRRDRQYLLVALRLDANSQESSPKVKAAEIVSALDESRSLNERSATFKDGLRVQLRLTADGSVSELNVDEVAERSSPERKVYSRLEMKALP